MNLSVICYSPYQRAPELLPAFREGCLRTLPRMQLISNIACLTILASGAVCYWCCSNSPNGDRKRTKEWLKNYTIPICIIAIGTFLIGRTSSYAIIRNLRVLDYLQGITTTPEPFSWFDSVRLSYVKRAHYAPIKAALIYKIEHLLGPLKKMISLFALSTLACIGIKMSENRGLSRHKYYIKSAAATIWCCSLLLSLITLNARMRSSLQLSMLTKVMEGRAYFLP